MSLKLRLNLIITGLLLLIMLIGAALSLNNARKNARAEIESAEKLVLYLLDTTALSDAGIILKKTNSSPFQLSRLNHMRHLKIEFRDTSGHVLDNNQTANSQKFNSEVPAWFESMLGTVTQVWEPTLRIIEYQGRIMGKLVITPDPTYEYAEIWKQITDSLILASIFLVSVNLMIAWAVGQALKPTEKILIALNELERGNLSARLPLFDLPELARIAQKFNLMIETLQQSISRNHRLSQQLITLQEEERKNLARDLHDEFGQCLTAIKADSTAILKLAESKYPEIQPSAQAIAKLSSHLMEMVSGLLERLRPGILDELGLASALQDLVETWKSRHAEIVCTLMLDNDISSVTNEAVKVTIYRIIQECLTNISRHAEANKVMISLRLKIRTELPNDMHIIVQDNGKGFDEAIADGFGLTSMRERVEGLGGKLTLITSKNMGTEVDALIPLENNK